MTVQLVIQVVLFLVSISCIISAGIITSSIIEMVNRKLPQDQQISPLGGYYSKYKKITWEYRRLYPNGRLIVKMRLLTALGFISIFAIAVGWRLGLFH
jgi:hypothetical protein